MLPLDLAGGQIERLGGLIKRTPTNQPFARHSLRHGQFLKLCGCVVCLFNSLL
jgi:hypothetical protein